MRVHYDRALRTLARCIILGRPNLAIHPSCFRCEQLKRRRRKLLKGQRRTGGAKFGVHEERGKAAAQFLSESAPCYQSDLGAGSSQLRPQLAR